MAKFQKEEYSTIIEALGSYVDGIKKTGEKMTDVQLVHCGRALALKTKCGELRDAPPKKYGKKKETAAAGKGK